MEGHIGATSRMRFNRPSVAAMRSYWANRLFVKRFALCYRCVVCLSVCLFVTLVYCGQTVRWLKMKLGMEVGLSPGHVLDGDPASPSPIFGSCLLWPNSWMDQDATWYEGRRPPRRHCVRWGPSSPQKKGHSPPQFSSLMLCCRREPSRDAGHLCRKLAPNPWAKQ